jgi:2-methylisocitrate lyase-like PEP mutase family enzyme
MRPTQREKALAFQALHRDGVFVIPNPWDAGSAKVLAALGFQALATTSSGFAYSLGRPDGAATLPEVVQHVRALDQATALPVSVDLENGYGRSPVDVARAIVAVSQAGAVGGSIEDFDRDGGIYPMEFATERVAGAVEAASQLDFPFTLTARAENHIRGNPDLDDTIARLIAYERAGADVLYAPGLRTVDDIRTVCASVSKPVNVLGLPGLTVSQIAGAGARRISVGDELTWVAASAMVQAAEQLRDTGDLSALAVPARISRLIDESMTG